MLECSSRQPPGKPRRTWSGFLFWGGLLCFVLTNSFNRTLVPTGKNPAATSWVEGNFSLVATTSKARLAGVLG